MLAEILNVVQVFTPAHAALHRLLLLLLLLLLFSDQRSASRKKMPKKPGKTALENTWVFPGKFGYYRHWTLEIVVGRTARPSLLLFSRPNVITIVVGGDPTELFCC